MAIVIDKEVAYICNGKKPECCGANYCAYEHPEGVCSHTTNPAYAKNAPDVLMLNPAEHPEVFEDCKKGWWERDEEELN